MIPYSMSDVVVKISQLMAIDSVLNNFSVSASYGEACYKTVLAVMDPLLVSFKKFWLLIMASNVYTLCAVAVERVRWVSRSKCWKSPTRSVSN